MQVVSSDDEEESHSPVRKSTASNGRLDPKVRALQTELKAKYFNVCKYHPDTSCFHYRPSNLHFILDNEKSLVWANNIVQHLTLLSILK